MTIFLGGNRVLSTNYGHLQVIYQGRELEVQSGVTWQFRNRLVDGETNGQPHTPGYGDPEHYAQTALNLGDRSSADVWHLLVNAHRQFASQFAGSIFYLGLTQNSNSCVTTLLSIVGIEVGGYLGLIDLPGRLVEPDPITGTESYIDPFNGYPGSGMNVLDRFSPNFTLSGWGSDDIIRTGTGNDSLSGNGGNDRIDGGAGQDSLDGGGGRDTLEGGAGQDQLYGGNGADLLYGGYDADTIFGGAGNDTLWFDEDDVIDAGAARDTAYLSSLPLSVSGQAISVAALEIDLHATSVEILVLPAAFTGVGGHRITGIGANDMVAAGGGNDSLVIDRTDGGAPAIVWGGAVTSVKLV